MKKKFIIYGIVTLAVLLIAAGTLLIVKNINKKPPVVVEQSDANATVPKEVSSAAPTVQKDVTFKGVDAVHWGRGTAKIIKTHDAQRIVFNDDFAVAAGPDLFVYLSPNEAGQELGEYASLGNLKSTSGNQEYVLPENYEDYKTLVIWCRAFGVTFATADLR